ncbi:MAG: hypothetical protein FWF56_02120 [Firmicutes bacterium]|nr:hypothetical protein [Bacillota bacterium]MCL1954114.1 hypothetical protein [Bacillota bacterium]
MGYSTIFEGIVFIEGDDNMAKKVMHINCDLSKTFGAQLKNLNDVKANLATQAKQHNCNCVVNFSYGQKSKWSFMFDNIGFCGQGFAAILSNDYYNTLVDKIKNRDIQ